MQALLDAPLAVANEGNGERIGEPWGNEPIRLNLGAGDYDLPGYLSIDRNRGSEVYPLDYPDNSIDEMLASHVLEHFSHRQLKAVLEHWIAKLRPGGRIRISVPDFGKLAELYAADQPVDLQGYLMGGQKDQNDFHGAIFDRDSLSELMAQCGLERISGFDGQEHLCSTRLGISLNLQGFKPASTIRKVSGVRAVMSAPRFGPTLHFQCHSRAFILLGINCKIGQSCYWAQRISCEMEDALKANARYVLTLDFDTVFSPQDVLELYRLMEAFPHIDALFPLQSKRNCLEALFSIADANGKTKTHISEADLQRQILRAATGHFGLTMFRASSLEAFKRPWMFPIPSDAGTWDKGHVDADIVFWKQFHAQGFKAFLAPRVVVGHLEEVIKWPDRLLKPVYQSQEDYQDSGIPAAVAR